MNSLFCRLGLTLDTVVCEGRVDTPKTQDPGYPLSREPEKSVSQATWLDGTARRRHCRPTLKIRLPPMQNAERLVS